MPETTTQAIPSLSRARTCVAVRANQKKKKSLKPRARNNHPGRSFALACPYVRGRTYVAVHANQKKTTFKQPHSPF